MDESNPRERQRSGFTLLELLITLAIVSLLLAIAIPAVQSAREQSRHSQCRSHLKQIGIGFQQYAEVHGVFPGYRDQYNLQLLPYLEQAALAEQIRANFSSVDVNVSVPLLHCPSDPHALGAFSSYPINHGYGYQIHGKNGLLPATVTGLRVADILDGMSNTAAFSELPVARAGEPNMIEMLFRRDSPALYEEFVDACSLGKGYFIAGPSESADLIGRGWYSHDLPPNHRSCLNGTLADSDQRKACRPAKSYHPSGVNTLMADGAVRFVGETVTREVWRATGSRNGGERTALE